MEPQYQKMIVLLIVLIASFATWKIVKDFYITKFHKVFAHLIAVVTSSFMLLSSMFLFIPQNYQRGNGQAEVELSFTGIATVVVMVLVLYLFFKYIPQDKK